MNHPIAILMWFSSSNYLKGKQQTSHAHTVSDLIWEVGGCYRASPASVRNYYEFSHEKHACSCEINKDSVDAFYLSCIILSCIRHASRLMKPASYKLYHRIGINFSSTKYKLSLVFSTVPCTYSYRRSWLSPAESTIRFSDH
jgi:hypothetical protein